MFGLGCGLRRYGRSVEGAARRPVRGDLSDPRRSLVRRLPQRAHAHGRSRTRHLALGRSGRRGGTLGTRCAQAPGWPHAPAGRPRPDREDLDQFASWLETELDRAGANAPNPGRPVLHRLNRTEYGNAVRDLLAVDSEFAASLVPPDASTYGFDNVADVLGVSPTLIERYLSAARKISRLAVGDPTIRPTPTTYRATIDLTQNDHLDGLPFGTRGGMLVRHQFPVGIRLPGRLDECSQADAATGSICYDLT